MARPSKYTNKLADQFCALIAEGQSVNMICKGSKFPSKATIFTWLRDKQEFLDNYTRAKEMGAEAIADEMFAIADDGTNDWMERLDKDGQGVGYQVNGEHIQRSRLRIETRKWHLAKTLPKKYGESKQVAISGKVDHEHKHTEGQLSAVDEFLSGFTSGGKAQHTEKALPH